MNLIFLKKMSLLLAVLVSYPFFIHAQDKKESHKELTIEKYRYSTYNFIKVDIEDSKKNQIVYDAILNQITGSGFNVIGTANIYDLDSYGEALIQRAINYAAEAEAQTALIVNVILQNDYGIETILIQSKVYRVSDKKMIASLSKKTFIDYTLMKTVDRIAEKLHNKAYYILYYSEVNNMSESQKQLVKAQSCTITIYCQQEGAEVYLSDTDLMGTIAGGELVLPFHPLALNQSLKITVKYEGFYDQIKKIMLDNAQISVKIGKFYKATIAAVDFYYTIPMFIGAGIGVRFYPIPDDLYLELKANFFGSGLFDDSRTTMFHNETTFKLGYYPILKGNSLIRFNINAGIGILNSVITDASVAVEQRTSKFDWFITMIELAVELNLPDVSIYISPEVRYYNPGTPGANAFLPSGILDSSVHSDFPVIINMGVLWKL